MNKEEHCEKAIFLLVLENFISMEPHVEAQRETTGDADWSTWSGLWLRKELPPYSGGC